MRRPYLLPVIWCLAALAGPAPASAQGDINPSADARYHLGPLGLQPRFRLTNIGVDTNVLNASSNPQKDFTATFVPEVDEFLKLGRSRFSGKTSVDFVYFQKLQEQRSIDVSQEAALSLLLTRFTPHLGGGYVSSDQRPNAEIDARVHRTVTTFGGGVSTKLAPAVSLDVSGSQSQFAFANVSVGGVSLATVLDRTTRSAGAKVMVELTPLTTFVVGTTAGQDRFLSAPERNTDAADVTVGVNLKRSALFSGTANVGIKWFMPQTATLQSYTGVVADVGLSYLLRDRTQFAVKVGRGTDYSVDVAQPYYVTTAIGLTVTHILVGHVDLVGRLGEAIFDYRSFAPAAGAAPVPTRNDRVTSLGLGVGYRLAAGARVGIGVSYDRRTSPVAGEGYRGFRLGGSFIYGY